MKSKSKFLSVLLVVGLLVAFRAHGKEESSLEYSTKKLEATIKKYKDKTRSLRAENRTLMKELRAMHKDLCDARKNLCEQLKGQHVFLNKLSSSKLGK